MVLQRFALAVGAGLLIACLTSIPAEPALALSVTLGDQDFADGTALSIPAFDAAAAGEPFPFDSFKGGDSSQNFSASWTFRYEPLPIASANLVLGLYDDDSHRPSDQVASFQLDSVDLTSFLNAELESRDTDSSRVYVYSLDLPGSALLELSDGEATFSLSLQSGCNCQLANGAGLDFTTLELVANVPEPATALLTGVGLAALAAGRRHRASGAHIPQQVAAATD